MVVTQTVQYLSYVGLIMSSQVTWSGAANLQRWEANTAQEVLGPLRLRTETHLTLGGSGDAKRGPIWIS